MPKGASAETALLSLQTAHILQAAAGGPLLVVEPPEAADVDVLRAEGLRPLTVYTSDLAVAQNLPVAAHAAPGPWLDSGEYAAAILYMPKSKARFDMLLAMLAPRLLPGAPLFIVGHNHSGLTSAVQRVVPVIGQPSKLDAARHCALYEAAHSVAHAPQSALSDWFSPWTLTSSEAPITLTSLPGVFSHGRLDEGTERLLRVLDLGSRSFSNSVLDLGCGAGTISLHIAHRWPQAQITACDVSFLAVASTAYNLGAHPNSRAIASDVFSALAGERFAHIVTNPPFHRGLQTEHAVTERIIREAPSHMKRGGSLWVVVNRFRDAPSLLQSTFGRAPERVHEDGHYTVLRAHKR